MELTYNHCWIRLVLRDNMACHFISIIFTITSCLDKIKIKELNFSRIFLELVCQRINNLIILLKRQNWVFWLEDVIMLFGTFSTSLIIYSMWTTALISAFNCSWYYFIQNIFRTIIIRRIFWMKSTNITITVLNHTFPITLLLLFTPRVLCTCQKLIWMMRLKNQRWRGWMNIVFRIMKKNIQLMKITR